MHGNNKTHGRAGPRGRGRRGPHRGRLLRGDRPAGLPGRRSDGAGPRSWSASPPGWRRTPTSSWPPRTTTRSSASRWPPGAADEAVRRVIACPGLEFAGLHSHIGSQIFDTAGFEVAAHRVVGLAVRIQRRARHRDRRARPGRRVRHRLHRRGRRPRGQGSRAEPARDRGRAVPGGRAGPAAADRRAGPRHRRPVHRVAVHGGHDQGRGRAADLRQRGRRDERQHQDRAVRRLLHCARWPRAPRPPRRCCPGWSAGTARAATSWSGTRGCPPTWPPATCWPCPPPAPTAGRWPATTTTSPARPWSRSARARPARSSAARPSMTCSAWTCG